MANGNALRLRARLHSSGAAPSNPSLALALPVVMNTALQGDVVSRINGVNSGYTASLTNGAGGMFALNGNHLVVGSAPLSGSSQTVTITETKAGSQSYVTNLMVSINAPAAGQGTSLDRTKLTSVVFNEDFVSPISLYDPTAAPSGTWDTIYRFGDRDWPTSRAPTAADATIAVDPYYRGLGLNPFSQEDGVLTVTSTATPANILGSLNNPAGLGGYPYYGGILTSRANYTAGSGASLYFEIRVRWEKGSGNWGAFWLLPSAGAGPPEFDISEKPGTDIYQWFTVHDAELSGGFDTKTVNLPDQADAFHTYGGLINTVAGTASWFVDGVKIRPDLAYPSDFLDSSFYILFTGGPTTGAVGEVDPSLAPFTRECDYIRVYNYTP